MTGNYRRVVSPYILGPDLYISATNMYVQALRTSSIVSERNIITPLRG